MLGYGKTELPENWAVCYAMVRVKIVNDRTTDTVEYAAVTRAHAVSIVLTSCRTRLLGSQQRVGSWVTLDGRIMSGRDQHLAAPRMYSRALTLIPGRFPWCGP